MFDLSPFWNISDSKSAMKTSWNQVFSAEKDMHAFLIHSLLILPLIPGMQADFYRPIKRTLAWTSTLHSYKAPKAQNTKTLDLQWPTLTSNLTEASKMLICSCVPRHHPEAQNRFNFILMESRGQSCLFCLSHMHFRCVLIREPLFAQLVLSPGEPDAAVTYWATIFTFHFSTTRSGRKLSGRYCDEITMSFSLSKELQSPGMKGAGLMGEMITCHGYKNGWSGEHSLRGNWRDRIFIFFFFFVEPL